ncbi:MAG: hypothetical protein CL534_10720 [Ahrensia sp.]|nr:hypothetical protein [Ahrensia sp.]
MIAPDLPAIAHTGTHGGSGPAAPIPCREYAEQAGFLLGRLQLAMFRVFGSVRDFDRRLEMIYRECSIMPFRDPERRWRLT